MRILITSAYTPEGETGSAQVAKRLSHKLSEEHRVMYLCLGKDLRVVKVKKNLWYLTIPSTNINDIWIPKLDSTVLKKINKELDMFSPEVVHAQNMINGGLISLIWAKERNIPYVLTFHSIPSEGMGYVFPKIQNGKIISTINYYLTANYVKNFVQHADLIIALNQPIVDSLKRMKIKTPYRIINNGLDLKKYYALDVNPPEEKVYFIYPGSYIDRKNQTYLLEVFSYLPKNYILNLFGNTTSGSNYVRNLRKIIDTKHLQSVIVNDFLNQEELLKQYEKSHYLVSASLKEVQSMVYVESLAAGHPVIALENETVDEVINSNNGIVLPKNTDSKRFAHKLKRFVQKTNNHYRNMSKICRASVTKFDIDTVSKALINAYKYAAITKSSKNTITETKFYQMIKDIVPEQILNMMPENFKFSKEREKTHGLKAWLLISSSFSMLISAIGLAFLKKRINN
jgi:glycosyltransferase involved in cell wall biosynthesis